MHAVAGLIHVDHGAVRHVRAIGLTHGLMLVGVEVLSERIDPLDALLGEHVEHLLKHHAHAIGEMLTAAARLHVRERPFKVVERWQHLRDHPLPGTLGRILRVARYPLAIVVEVGLQPLSGIEVRGGFPPRTLELVLKLIAPELILSTEVVEHREGGDPSSSRKSPGRTEYEAITLERGVTHDKDFEQWANKVWNFGSGLGAEVSLKDFRKDIIIEVYNEAGQLALAYKVYRCWVSEFQSQADLDANANAVLIQNIKLENEGWERDYEVTEPAEPSFTEPA